MGWATAIQAGTSLLGGMAARKGAQAQGRAAQQGVDYTKGIYNQAQGNLSPYMQAGQGGLAGLASANAGDYSGFMNSPDYLYARDQAQSGIEHGASARGALFSPGTQVELGKQLSGLRLIAGIQVVGRVHEPAVVACVSRRQPSQPALPCLHVRR